MKVRCINNNGFDLTVGDIYTVIGECNTQEPHCYILEENNVGAPETYYDKNLFEKVEKD